LKQAARAAEHEVRGVGFVLADPLPDDNPPRRHAFAAVRDRRGPGIVGNPLASGVTVTLLANGATPTVQTFEIPPGAFTEPDGPGWTGRVRRGRRVLYTYRDERGTNGPVTSIRLQSNHAAFLIAVTVDARADDDVALVPPNPGTDAGMILSINDGDTYCAGFGGAAGGKITDNDANLFRVSKPRLATCPFLPPSSPSGAFVEPTVVTFTGR